MGKEDDRDEPPDAVAAPVIDERRDVIEAERLAAYVALYVPLVAVQVELRLNHVLGDLYVGGQTIERR